MAEAAGNDGLVRAGEDAHALITWWRSNTWRAAMLAIIVCVVAALWSSGHGLMTLYADARSHLTISRRLVDGPNQGVVQLGTVWLPLPHLLLVPTVMVKSWWHSGWAVVPLNALCLAAQATAIFKMAAHRWNPRVAWMCTALLLSSASLLYVHTTAFTEPVLLAAVTVTIAGLYRWSTATKAYSGGEMAIFCGVPAAAGVLARYDGWAIAVACAVCVWWVAWRRWRDRRYAWKMVGGFLALPMAAAAWWCWFNWVHFGDPFEFQRGRYSAQAQQEVLDAAGKLPDSGNLIRSISTYLDAVVEAVGWVPLVVAVVGLAVFAVQWAKGSRRAADAWVFLLLLVPFAFYIWSLFSGQIAVRTVSTATSSLFNIRYGLAVLPGLVLLAAPLFDAIVQRSRQLSLSAVALPAVAVLVLAGGSLVEMVAAPGWRSLPVIAEGLEQRSAGTQQYAAIAWMRSNADTGRIMIDDSINPMLPVLDADLHRVIAPFSTDWPDAQQDVTIAEWLFVDLQNPDDEVAAAVAAADGFEQQFEVAYSLDAVVVYHRKATDEG